MAIVAISLGYVSGGNGTAAITGVSIPPGSLIVVGIGDGTPSISNSGSVTDSAGNSYTSKVSEGDTTNGYGSIFVINSPNATTVSSITYTSAGGVAPCVIAALYLTGAATSSPVDAAVTAAAQSGSGTPSVTSGVPSVVNEFFVAWTTSSSNGTFVQDTTDGWVSTYGLSTGVRSTTGTGDNTIGGGGSQQVAGLTAKTFAPTGFSAPWAAMVLGIKPAGLLPTGFNMPMLGM